jgi:ArsR family transcriptional regulator, arsenate/arsenite/antimonite-responsive transcriptional repressor
MNELAAIFKALSDETRFELVTLLLTQDLCVGALARRLAISEAAVSQHLKQLREAGLVRGEKRGYWTHYAVERDRLSKLAEALIGLSGLARCPDEPAPINPTKKPIAERRERKCGNAIASIRKS